MTATVRLVPGLDPIDRTDPDANWQARGACNGAPADLFFPSEKTAESVANMKEAKRICSTCEVRVECLEYALAARELFGVWGGMSERERARLRRVNGQAHPARMEAASEVIRTLGQVTSSTLAQQLNISDEAAANTLGRMHTAGLVDRTHRLNRRWVYQLAGDNQ